MSLISIKIPDTIKNSIVGKAITPRSQQLRVLRKLLNKARFTEFGQAYGFDEILMHRHPGKAFQQRVPCFDYSTLYKAYWHKTLDGVPDVCWPGSIKFFALSSGTSEAASKYIPITKDLIRSNNITSIRQLISLAGYHDVNFRALPKGWLMLGGSTELQKGPTYFAGDLSGIQQRNIPFWFQRVYKPGKKIARERDWSKKIQEIVDNAPQWDIGFIMGVPAWIQLCLEGIIARYGLKNIHELWPNLSFYVHGGVSLEPYRKSLEKLWGKPVTYIETYLASEGFLAYQSRQHAEGMKLAINNNIFFEFVPFNEQNFDADYNLVEKPEALMIHEVEAGKEYAVLISTNAGAWRYLIGDTIKFVDLERQEIVITGRTRHFLSVCGEHLSVDNLNKAIQLSADELNLELPEYTVAGIPHENLFAHQWWVACDDANADADRLKACIDKHLKELNDDYITERAHALKDIFVRLLPESTFLGFMKSKGKIGAQHKFPRVMKGKMLEEWQQYLQQHAPTKA